MVSFFLADGAGGPGLTGMMTIISGGCMLWTALFFICLNSPISEYLATKHKNGPLAAKVDTTDRCLAFFHSAISGGFGIYAWVAVPLGLCNHTARQESVMRMGVAITASFMIYDFAMLFAVEVVMELREYSWAMYIHHINIIPMFLIGLHLNVYSWFLCACLINEVSTLPLHVCYFLNRHGHSGTTVFFVFGVMLLASFGILRVVAIGGIATVFWIKGACGSEGAPQWVVIYSSIVFGVHFILNFWWYVMILKMVAGKSKKDPGATPQENVPLIATEAGLGPTPPEEAASPA